MIQDGWNHISEELLDRIAEAKETGGYAIPTSITVNAPDLPEVSYKRKG